MAHVNVYVGEDWWTHLSTYPDHTPILSIDVGSVSLSISTAENSVGTAAVEFTRELAERVTLFAAEIERLYAQHGGETAAADAAGEGEAA